METIIVATISTLGVIITTIIQVYHASKKDKIESKIDDLRKEVDAMLG